MIECLFLFCRENAQISPRTILHIHELKSGFNELQILKHLRNAGITKVFGFSCASLFKLIFCLIFEQKNWFRLLESKKSESLPEKDTIYRFLNYSKYKWHRFLLSLSAATASKVSRLTKSDCPKVLIVDGPAYERNRSKKVELLARCFNHASQKIRFYKGFRMLILGWSDGTTFMPIDFSFFSSKKNQKLMTSRIKSTNELPVIKDAKKRYKQLQNSYHL